MKNKFWKVLEEVWSWKEKVYEETKDMTWEEERRYFDKTVKRWEKEGIRLPRISPKHSQR